MRKLLFGALVALLVLLVLPGAVSAAGDSDTIVISGTIGDYIDVTVANSLDWANPLNVGSNEDTTAGTLTVTSNTGWSVAAADQNSGTGTGYMLNSGTPLANAIQIKNGETGSTYAVLNIGTFFASTGNDSTGIAVQQTVVTGDGPGTYTITIVFTGATL